jgi:putative transposase
MVNRDRTDLSLTRQCRLLKISRSSLYYAPIGMNAETLELMNEPSRDIAGSIRNSVYEA